MRAKLPVLNVRLRAQIVKEMLSLLRDPRSRFVLIGPPILQLFVFAFAATLDVRNVDLAVYDRDGGAAAHELVATLAAAEFVHALKPVRSQAALREAIDRREVLAAVVIPETFSREAATGRSATAQLILDGRRGNAAQITLGYLQQIAADAGARLSAEMPAPEAAVVRHWFNPNLNYRWFIVPSLAGILTTMIALLVTALSIARERELGTFDQLRVSPTAPHEIIISKTVPALLIGSLLCTLMILAGVLAFRIPFVGSALWLAPTVPLYIASVVGVGLMISAFCATQQQAILGTFAVAVPMVLMSGFATPVENMPHVLQWLAEAIPLKHFLTILQGSFLKSLPATEVLAHAWPLLAISAVSLSGATLLVRSRLQ